MEKANLKKLLFLYPIKEFFWYKPEEQYLIKLMDIIINERYRNKGYEVNFLVYGDREVDYLTVKQNDKVLKSDVKISGLTSGMQIPYTNNNLIQKLLGPVNELVVCGFHEIDCVRKVARHFYDLGIDTLVDIELTDILNEYSKLVSFNIEKYNIIDTLGCNFASITYKAGGDIGIYCPELSMYGMSPYYKFNTFIPTHTWQEWLEIIKNEADEIVLK